MDNNAEKSIDPIYERFEGYLIYRATDPSFNTIKITIPMEIPYFGNQ